MGTTLNSRFFTSTGHLKPIKFEPAKIEPKKQKKKTKKIQIDENICADNFFDNVLVATQIKYPSMEFKEHKFENMV